MAGPVTKAHSVHRGRNRAARLNDTLLVKDTISGPRITVV